MRGPSLWSRGRQALPTRHRRPLPAVGHRPLRAGQRHALRAVGHRPLRAGQRHALRAVDWRRLAPIALAAVLAGGYAIASPPSLDLAAHLLRAKLFASEGFGLWDNWWYGGHHVLLYSVLFPAVAATITPQLAAGLAAVAGAVLFDALVRHQWGQRAWLGSLWFAAATATNLFTGRLTFAFGLAPAVGAAVALQRRRPLAACALALLTALCSPVDALFAVLVGAAHGIGQLAARRPRVAAAGGGVVAAALAPLAALAMAFPEGGTEPFAFSAFWPLPVMAAGALLLLDRHELTLRVGVVLYLVGCVASFALPTAVGSNAARLGEMVAGPLAALLLWPQRRRLLLALAAPLVYVQWHAPVRDLATAAADSAGTVAYYRPLLNFLERQDGPPFRVEIPFTRFHWEAYAVAPRFPLARGWERQLDIEDNHLFYGGRLTPATYRSWLMRLAVRFVAVADASLDYSAVKEVALIDRGLPYLRLVARTGHWRIYRVVGATPIAQGAATATVLGPNWVDLQASRPGPVYLRVRYTPYWAITRGAGCVAPAGQFTRLAVRRAGAVRLAIDFAPSRIGAHSPRCS
jgi:hypothetical protein